MAAGCPACLFFSVSAVLSVLWKPLLCVPTRGCYSPVVYFASIGEGWKMWATSVWYCSFSWPSFWLQNSLCVEKEEQMHPAVIFEAASHSAQDSRGKELSAASIRGQSRVVKQFNSFLCSQECLSSLAITICFYGICFGRQPDYFPICQVGIPALVCIIFRYHISFLAFFFSFFLKKKYNIIPPQRKNRPQKNQQSILR